MIRWVMAAAVMWVAVASLGDDAKTGTGIRDINAKTAEVQYEQAIARMDAEYHRQAALHRQKLINELTAAQKDATKRGDLEDAVRMRDRISELEAQTEATRPKPVTELSAERNRLSKRVTGTTWSFFPNVKPPRITFDGDGTCHWGENKTEGYWVAISEHNLIIQHKEPNRNKPGYCYLLVFDDKLSEYRMFPLGPSRKEDGTDWTGRERK